MKISITYKNGTTHEFEVISNENDYIKIIKPLNKRLNEILSLNKKQQKKLIDEKKDILLKLEKYKFNWCTDKSPIYKSLKTQQLDLGINQGNYKVKTVII